MPLQDGALIGDSNLGLERNKIDYDVFSFCGGWSPCFYGGRSPYFCRSQSPQFCGGRSPCIYATSGFDLMAKRLGKSNEIFLS